MCICVEQGTSNNFDLKGVKEAIFFAVIPRKVVGVNSYVPP